MRSIPLLLIAALIGSILAGGLRAAPADAAAKRLRIVILGAHCDDPETGCGGLVAMLTQAGHEVILAYATTFRGQRKVGNEPEDVVRRRESTAACAILGATPKFFDWAHEDLSTDPAGVKTVSKWLKQVAPDIVLVHWPLDTHPNHHAISSLVWQCYDHGGQIWGQTPTTAAATPPSGVGWNLCFYEVNTFTDYADLETLCFQPTLYLDIGKVRDIKKRAVDCFKSQAQYNLWQVQDNMHRRRGQECGVPYAEAYVLVEAKKGCPLLPVTFLKRRPE
jgi:LmbE family N-acetylglucosaminyl deacetylase